MHGQNIEGWRGLCEHAAFEQDPLKLMQLVSEINRMLPEKEDGFSGENKKQRSRTRLNQINLE